MKTLPPGLAARLAQPVTTLARAWIATRRDGAVFGFIDHDRDLTVAGVLCRAATGVARSDAVAAAGLAVGGEDIAGALSSASITEADIAAGRWDGAEIRAYLVDWTAPEAALHLTTATLGEVTRRDGAFSAELRALAAQLDQPRGRIYQHRCDAALGDARCGVALAGLAATGTVVSVAAGRHVVVAGLPVATRRQPSAGGTLVATTGASAGDPLEIKADDDDGDGRRRLELWQPAPGLAAGDAVGVTPGCDKRFETCRDRFANALNFRGFPHIPGTDFLLAHPASRSEAHDGGALMP